MTIDLHDPLMSELAQRIVASWVQIRRGASMARLREYMLGSGDDALEQGQMDTLDRLAEKPSWRMSDLAEALRVDPSTATRAVQRLVNAGLATRGPSDGDGRVVIVCVTDAGSARHAAVSSRRSELMSHMLAAYSAKERPQLADMLERFVGAVDDFVANLPSDPEEQPTDQ